MFPRDFGSTLLNAALAAESELNMRSVLAAFHKLVGSLGET